MRARRLALAVAILAALALASCSGGAPPEAATPAPTSTPAPTAIATPEAASTPAPTATPTTEAALTPEQACANGVAVSGVPPRVTGLDLRGKGLTGSIPRELRRLRLDAVRLGGNALSGCVPSAFEDASGDAASLGLPWCLRYRLDATAEVASAGEWAILGGNGEALTTWEQLRSEAATLRVHQTDAGGNSWASEFGAVAVNDLFEWRKTDDCWVRYRVTGEPTPPSGASGRWEFPVEWMTYAATGAGCTGEVGAGTVLSVDEAAPALSPFAITSPVRHGVFLVFPGNWGGALEAVTIHEPPPLAAEGATGADDPVTEGWAESLAEARRFRYWRDPVLPAGWRFRGAVIGRWPAPVGSYHAVYVDDSGYLGAEIEVGYTVFRPVRRIVLQLGSSLVTEPRVIDGFPAMVQYQPLGGDRSVEVWIFNPETGTEYLVRGYGPVLSGSNDEAVIAIARSLYRSEAP